jgi:hypothetical protein
METDDDYQGDTSDALRLPMSAIVEFAKRTAIGHLYLERLMESSEQFLDVTDEQIEQLIKEGKYFRFTTKKQEESDGD